MNYLSPSRILVIQPVSLESIFLVKRAFQSGQTIILNTSQLNSHQAEIFLHTLSKEAIRLKGEIIFVDKNVFLFTVQQFNQDCI